MSQASLRFYGFEMLALVGPNHRNGLLVVHDAEQNGYQGGEERSSLMRAGKVAVMQSHTSRGTNSKRSSLTAIMAIKSYSSSPFVKQNLGVTRQDGEYRFPLAQLSLKGQYFALMKLSSRYSCGYLLVFLRAIRLRFHQSTPLLPSMSDRSRTRTPIIRRGQCSRPVRPTSRELPPLMFW